MSSNKQRLLKIDTSKADRRLAQKIRKYLRRDQFHKLRAFFSDNIIHPDSVLNRKGQAGLHLACKLGHPDCVNVFLRHGASKRLQDFKGNIPLHFAVKFCMKQPSYPSNLIGDLVTKPFLGDIELIHVPNKKGTTPKLLLDALNRSNDDLGGESTSSSEESLPDGAADWCQKLKQEEDEEHFEEFGKFEETSWDDEESARLHRNVFNETYDQWADRIYAEFAQRRKRPSSTRAHNNEEEGPLPPPKAKRRTLRPEVIKQTRPKENIAFARKIENLFDKDSVESITSKSLPFDESTPPDDIVTQLLGHLDVDHNRKGLKDVIRNWHPDKFSQQFYRRIHPDHKDTVLRIVTHVSQALLNFGKQ